MLLERETRQAPARRGRAIAAFAALAGLALLAHAGRLAETPVGAATPGIGALGPARLGQLRAVQLDPQGRVPAGMAQKAQQALAAAPLAYEPFFAAAAAGFRNPRDAGSARDVTLLKEALHRNPRSRESRLFLMRHAVATGDLGGAIDQIAALNRLNGATEQLMLGVGQAINTPKLVDEAATALRPHPELFNPFLRGFTSARKPRDIAIRMVTSLPPSAMQDEVVRRMAIRELVRVQAFAEARRLWGSAVQSAGLVHSPDFTDTKAPPPFNWDVTADETGAAERIAGGGVSLDYFGRTPGPLVSQLLTLAPGSYRAKIVYRSESGTPGALGLQVRCVGQDANLIDRPLDARIGVNQALTVPFSVSAGCAGQLLSLAGRVRETRESQQATVKSVEIERVTQ